MSAILGLFSGRASLDQKLVRPMLHRMRNRGAERWGTWSGPAASLGVSRHLWETDLGMAGPAEVARDGRYGVVADATLYRRAALRSRLEAGGWSGPTSTASQLILAAYRAWGPDGVAELDGDFAFLLWDSLEHRVVCGRDPGGRRPLCYAVLPQGLVVASTPSAILAHPDCPADLDLAMLGATAAGMLCSAEPQTVFRAIQTLSAGHVLTWTPGAPAAPRRFWVPEVRERPRVGFADAAAHLRHLLADAARERFAPSGPTTVWMSGGWDSTAVFAAGQDALGDDGLLQPVSISYPPDDPGREDELIRCVADFWNREPHWIDADAIPLLEGPHAWAASRDEPFTHLYDRWNRALAQGSRACGSRVALDGNGGDQLFQVSDVFLSDLLRQGRWWSLAREWREKRGKSVRNFVRWALLPALPATAVRILSLMRRNSAPRSYLERVPPRWIRTDFRRRHRLRERERAALPPEWPGRRAEAELFWYLTAPIFPRAFAAVASFALQEGVELRSPLYDRRVIEFAAARPREERSTGPETKRLLRRALAGLLPSDFLAPRPRRTGLTRAYSARQMRVAFPGLRSLFSRPLLLAEAGIVDPSALQASFESFLSRGDVAHRVELFQTLQTELWLRARMQTPPLSQSFSPIGEAGVAPLGTI